MTTDVEIDRALATVSATLNEQTLVVDEGGGLHEAAGPTDG